MKGKAHWHLALLEQSPQTTRVPLVRSHCCQLQQQGEHHQQEQQVKIEESAFVVAERECKDGTPALHSSLSWRHRARVAFVSHTANTQRTCRPHHCFLVLLMMHLLMNLLLLPASAAILGLLSPAEPQELRFYHAKVVAVVVAFAAALA